MSSPTDSSKHTVLSVKDLLKNVERTPITMGNSKGHFIRESDLSKLAKKIESYRADSHELDDVSQALDNAESELKSMKKENERLETLNENLKKLAIEEEAKSIKLQSELSLLNKEKHSAIDKRNKEKEELVANLNQWKKYANDLKEQMTMGEQMLDSDIQKTLESELESARDNVKQAQKGLEDNNKLVAKATRNEELKAAELARVTADFQAMKSRWEDSAAIISALKVDKPPWQATSFLASIKIDPQVAKYMGPKAMEWFKQLEQVAPEKIRDGVFALVQTTRSSKDKRISKLSWLLQELFDWIKTVGYKVRSLVKPWLDMIIADIATGKVKTVMFYRESLEAIVKDHKFENKAYKQKHKMNENDKLPFIENVAIWAKVLLINKPKRAFKRGVGWFSTAGLSIRRIYSSVKDFLVRVFRPTDPHIITDVKGKKIDMRDYEAYGDSASNFNEDEIVEDGPIPESLDGFKTVPTRHKNGESSKPAKPGKLDPKKMFNPFGRS